MDLLSKKGQTALEYILLIVILLSIVIAVLFWTGAFSTTIKDETHNKTDATVCATWHCTSNNNCTAIEACGPTATCDTGIFKCQLG